ncbi:MAG: DUF3887 domain-containing protein [Actinobacteria bacterium]|nr:DUF3887 domain-containing protein [Actinomycetota bacterium]MBV8958698.1 DUF3887 domain-containing protein [Actinomycetota bacterium]MBV9666107.1 DUF3887 domain-containing protein [Actinomycetota bacterium]
MSTYSRAAAVAVAVAIGLVLMVSACGTKTKAARGPFSSRAAEVTTDLGAGKFDAVAAMFGPVMKGSLSVSRMATDWQGYEVTYGRYRRHGTPKSVMKGQVDVERVPVTMEQGKGEVRVSFDRDGTIAGLYFLKADAPAP